VLVLEVFSKSAEADLDAGVELLIAHETVTAEQFAPAPGRHWAGCSVEGNCLGSVSKYRAVGEVIVDGKDSRNVFCRHADRPPLLTGLSITPEVDNSVGNRHAQIVGVRPGLLLQFAKQLPSNRAIGKGHFELRPSARNNLDQFRAADDPTRLPTSLTIGTRLIRCSSNNDAISCNGVPG